jgi:2,3-dihydroxybenzoate-AMP ligase
MLEGFVPFPPDFAARYRAKGYWRDVPLRDELKAATTRYAGRVAVIAGERSLTYGELDAAAERLALNLLEVGLQPAERVVVQLPNVLEFPILYLALQKIGCIPIAALVQHRYAELSRFVALSGASAWVGPARAGDVDFTALVSRVKAESRTLRHAFVLGEAPPGFDDLAALIRTPARQPAEALERIAIAPDDPAVFQLSGGTTGVPKLIPRTHNDYAYNSRQAAAVCGVTGDSVLLIVLPIAHNLPLACPGLQGYLFNGARVVLGPSTRPEEVFALIERHRVTTLKVVPALLIRLLGDPAIARYDLSSLKVIQSGGQRLQPEVRRRTRVLLPGAWVQENFGMAEGLLMFVRPDDPAEVQAETAGRPICPDDEVRLLDENDREAAPGAVGELCCRGPYTIRGYYGVPEYNARAFTADGFYRSGDLMRRHPGGNYIVEGRRKDLINRGGEKISAEEVENLILQHPAVRNAACVPMPDPALGERTCAYVVLWPGGRLDFGGLIAFLEAQEIARFKLPERLEIIDELPVSAFGKVCKNLLVEQITAKLTTEAAAGPKR